MGEWVLWQLGVLSPLTLTVTHSQSLTVSQLQLGGVAWCGVTTIFHH